MLGPHFTNEDTEAQQGPTIYTQLHKRQIGTRPATFDLPLSHTNTELRKILLSNKDLLKAYWVPGTARGTGDLATDRTVPILWELAFHVRRLALNTQYKMNMKVQWVIQV